MHVHTHTHTQAHWFSEFKWMARAVSFFCFLFPPHLHPSSLSPAHFLKLQNCCSAVGSQLRLSAANSLIKNSVSGPIQALKAPLNGFSCRVPSLETINIHIRTLHAVISTPIVGIIQLQSHFFFFFFLFLLLKACQHIKIPVSCSLWHFYPLKHLLIPCCWTVVCVPAACRMPGHARIIFCSQERKCWCFVLKETVILTQRTGCVISSQKPRLL